jgi:hypothetical protein
MGYNSLKQFGGMKKEQMRKSGYDRRRDLCCSGAVFYLWESVGIIDT